MPKYEWVTRTATGDHEPHHRDVNTFHRGRGSRSKAPTKAKSKDIKLKDECWTALGLRNFFLNDAIHADKTLWIIHFDKPNRKMTAADQLTLMLQPDELEHLVRVSYHRKHLIIADLNGLKE